MSRHFQPFSSIEGLYRLSLWIGCLVWLSLMIFAGVQTKVPIEYLTRDPAVLARHPEYYGALSNLGVLLWSATTAVCLMGALQVRALDLKQRDKEDLPTKPLGNRLQSSRFLTDFGLLSGILCMDDLFLLHESIIPNRLSLVEEEVIFAIYAISLVYLLVRFRKLWLKIKPGVLVSSLLLFATSLAVDRITPTTARAEQALYLAEDGVKLLAIFLWLAYFVWATLTLTTAPTQSSSTHKPTGQIRSRP